MISENDKKKSARQVADKLREMYPGVRDVGQLNEYLLGLINRYPPGEPDEPGVPCEHGFDDSFWCAFCTPPQERVEWREIYGPGGYEDRGAR